MTLTVRLVAASILGCIGGWMIVANVGQRRPSLDRVVAHLQRQPVVERQGTRTWTRLSEPLGRLIHFGDPVLADLHLVQRPVEMHAAMLVAAASAGLFVPFLLLAVGQLAGLVSLAAPVPIIVVALVAVCSPLLVHSSMRQQAADLRRDLRYQLSAYLDVVTMLLAGNVGNEGSLRQAAQAGDGRLFVELRRRIMIAETSSRSLVSALGQLGNDLDLVELQQVAASASLATGSGAPVARSLAAKCATLRSALASEQEADARVRTGKITVPLVGMSLLIMAAVIYPALNFSR